MHFNFNHHPQHYFDLEHPVGQHKVVSYFHIVDAKSSVDVILGHAPTESDLDSWRYSSKRICEIRRRNMRSARN